MAVKGKASRRIHFVHVPQSGLTIAVSPSSLTFNTSTTAVRTVTVEVFRDGKKLIYGDDFVCSTLATGSSVTKGLNWSFTAVSGTFSYSLTYIAGNDISMAIPFKVTVDGVAYPASICVQTVKNGTNGTGSDGRNGVWIPPMMLWSEYPDDYLFQAGDPSSGDVRLDMVLIKAANGNLIPYYCLNTHVKGDSPYSPETDSEFWAPADAGVYKCLATELLAAKNARIDFLSGQAIRVGNGAEMCGYFGAPTPTGAIFYTGSNSESNATFLVYSNGRIVAKNADIEGRICTSIMDYKVSTAAEGAIPNGSLCYQKSSIKLPALASGTVRSIRVFNPCSTRTAAENLTLIPENSNVCIVGTLEFDLAQSKNVTIQECGMNGRCYLELLGINIGGITKWGVVHIA